MEWLVVLMSGGAGTYAVWRARALVAERRERAIELEQARRYAEEDVTVFGEQLTRLDHELAGRELDPDARQEYQTALDAYEQAKRAVPRCRDRNEIGAVTDALALGRFTSARVRARVAGLPLPERRRECFFNPQHGPSVTDVLWTPRGRGTRILPACRRCAAMVQARQRPEIRTVRIGALSVPYWDAATTTLPFDYSYFAAGQVTGPTVSWITETSMFGDWDMGHWDWNKRNPRR